MTQPLSRGLRNHNPGNIRHSSEKYQGEVTPSSDPDFKQFINDSYGYLALLRILSAFITSYGCRTLRGLFAHWPPLSVNSTRSYLNWVCQHSKIGADEPLDPSNERQMCKLAAAISHYENGLFPRMKDITAAWKLLKEN